MDGGRMDVYTLQSECHHVRLSADQEAFILYSKYIYTQTHSYKYTYVCFPHIHTVKLSNKMASLTSSLVQGRSRRRKTRRTHFCRRRPACQCRRKAKRSGDGFQSKCRRVFPMHLPVQHRLGLGTCALQSRGASDCWIRRDARELTG